ncbi:phage tail protein [Escherichia coli]|nr:phage tail protein [Escherichia coli]
MPFARYFCIFINVGLGEGSALPVGVPVPWPSATPPTGWLKCNGADFSAEEYPELAKAYPTNKLPDLRGEFIRGWDDGRGADNGRVLLSTQGDAFKVHSHNFDRSCGLKGFDPTGGFDVVTADVNVETINQPTRSTVDVGGSETRPRNIAFNYIVRAV